MTLTDFYEYLFGDKALIKFDKRIESDESLKNRIQEKKEKEIQEAFQRITDPSNGVHKKFLNLLSALQTPGANALKQILYPQEQSLSENQLSQLSKIKNRYDSNHIKLIFKNINRKFKYFSEEDNQVENDFVTFFAACKLMGDFVERNNDDANTLASDLAYKMLVTFGAGHEKKQHLLANVETYLREHADKQSEHPIHDALTQAIPVNDPPLNDLNGWRRLIRTYGYKALEFFQEAPAIEKFAGKAPDTIEEAEMIASKISYPRANEYPELARYCKRYHIGEAIFNRCLEIEKNCKKSDKLPNVQINGADVSKVCEGYHLVKLPIDDPRAYILGNITDCCQSIGGHSEKCVIDGITRQNNGFYVLLKQKRKPYTNKPPLIEGHIDDASYDIVGQGYAWLSTKGNMVFDSWENLRPEADDKIVVPLLEKFAQEVTDKTENILKVTIGTGGKTPSYFASGDKKVSLPEPMTEGIQYGDSKTQGFIYFNEFKCLSMLQKYGLLDHNSLQKLRGNKNIYNFLVDSLLSAIYILHEANPALINQENFNLLIAHAEHSGNIVSTIATLRQANPALINQEIFNLLIAHAKRSGNIISAIATLHKANPALINEKNLNLLIVHAEHSENIYYALFDITFSLKKVLINDKIFQLLISHAEHSRTIANALIKLDDANPAFINDENLELLSAHAEHSKNIATALFILYRANPALVNDENRQLIVAHAEHSENIAAALVTLYNTNPAFINDENRELLGAHAQYSSNIAYALVSIYEKNPALLNDENRQLLGTHARFLNNITNALNTLYRTNPDLYNLENFQFLGVHAEYSENIATTLSILYRANPACITDENRQLLGTQPQLSKWFAYILTILQKANPGLINNNNFQLLCSNVKHLSVLFYTLQRLQEANPTLINHENFQLLVAHAEHSNNIYSALCILQEKPGLINDNNLLLLATHAANAIDICTQLVNIFKLVSDSNALQNLTNSSNQNRLFTQNISSMYEIYKKIKKFLSGDKSISFNKDEITALEKMNYQSNYDQVFKSLPVVDALENQLKNKT